MVRAGTEPISVEYDLDLVDTFIELFLAKALTSVVFVHGLKGDSVESWTFKNTSNAKNSRLASLNPFRKRHQSKTSSHTGDGSESSAKPSTRDIVTSVFWPQDLLADEIPNARLLTFGYSSAPLEIFAAANRNNIKHYAQNLLGDLLGERDV